ncbi:MAG: LptA/OstA family protein, partial [Desulfomicrobium sp.]|nr:LptA/OstA family protein [Desulfomicrobium sp.]
MLFLFLAIAAPLWAAQDVPVKITSDTMTYTQAGDQVVFKGKVYVIRQDIELWSDVLTVLLEKKDSPKSATQSVADDQGS